VFGPPGEWSIGPYKDGSNVIVFDITAGDLNRDGHADVIEATSEFGVSSGLRILLGNGHGGFLPARTVATAGIPESVAIGDLDGDLKPDVAVLEYTDPLNALGSGQLEILRGDGTGGVVSVAKFAQKFSAIGLRIADLNADTVPDLVLDVGGPVVALGIGGGAFAAPKVAVTSTTPGIGGYVGTGALADVNADGHLDVSALAYPPGLNQAPAGLTTLLGNANGTFTPSSLTAAPAGGAFTTSAEAADLNADGKPDLVTADFTHNNVSVLLGNGNGTFQSPTAYGPIGVGPSTIRIVDVNGDGRRDVVVACLRPGADYTLGRVSILLGDGKGHLGAATDVGNAASNADAGLVATDLNGDGHPDLAYSYDRIAATGPSRKTLETLQATSGSNIANALKGIPATLVQTKGNQIVVPLRGIGITLAGRIGLQQTLVTGTPTVRAAATPATGLAPPVFARSRYSLRRHGRTTVRLTLRSAARKALARRHRIRAAVEITVHPKGRAPQTIRRYITLKARRRA
jgi:hypothetical protein